MRRRTLPRSSVGKINVTPLIDVVMVLVVFYLIVGKMASDQRADLPLPTSATGAQEDPSSALVVEVRRPAPGQDGPRMSLAGVDVSIAALEAALRAELQSQPDLPIRIRADRTLEYGAVSPAIEAARRAGAGMVRLATERTGP